MDRVIWHVSEDGDDDDCCGSESNPCATIQNAIDYSNTDDTVLVAPGTYRGLGNRDIRFGGRRITVMSEEGAESTIIDCQGTGQRRGFEIANVDTFTVIDGFTIMNGNNTIGGGIYCFFGGSPKIINCIIKGNTGGTSGGGIGIVHGSNPVIRNCEIKENEAPYGGGIHIFNNCSPTVDNCIIWHNNALRRGGGIHSDRSQPAIENCTITLNYADSSGGGIYYEQSDSTIRNCILWGDYPNEIDTVSSSPIVEYCDIQGGWGVPPDTSLNCDPLFCYPDTGNFYLASNSCCLGAGCDSLGNPDSTVDIGALGLGCGPGVIYGLVTGLASRDPLDSVIVQATLSGGTTGTDTTDTNGNYYIEIFIPKPHDTVDVRFTCSGYISITVEDIEINPGDYIELNVQMVPSPCCDYVPGDANGDGQLMGNDVTYSVRYFKGPGDPPPDSCWYEVPDTSYWLYSGGDANGNCQYAGSDVTYLVAYFKGVHDCVEWCPQTLYCDTTITHACPHEEPVLSKEGQPIIRSSNLNRK